MMSAKHKFDWLKTKGLWRAKSPDNEKIVAMTTALNPLKGQLKLDPKLSAIASEGKKKGNKKDKRKNKKNTYNQREQKKVEAWKKEPPKEGEKHKREVGKYTYHWCEHHMAWTVHKPTDCLLGMQHKEDQKKRPQKAVNSTTFAAAAKMALNPQLAVLMASIANLDEFWCAPSWVWIFIMLAFMARLTMHTGQQVAYLYMFIMPYLLWYLLQADRSQTPEGNIQCGHLQESMLAAAQREENSFHPQVPLREEEAKHAFADRIDSQSKTKDSPCPNCSLHLKGLLSS
jgi:hypothetical protein